jgi:succinate dehydrogenase / fumarate reductase iron-sulfur subunit
MEVTLNVRRYDPDSAKPAPYYQEYAIELEESLSVLDGLIKVRVEVDGSLALRCSCRSAVCGSCAMRVNGHAVLACKTKVKDVLPRGTTTLTVEPAGNMPIIKDLVVEFNVFWDKIRAVEPWLQPEGAPPQHEYLAPNQDMLHLAGVMACIMCGACVSDCTVLEVDSNFLGPAALAKAYRFVADPRDDAEKSRLGKLVKYGGVWDCTRCMQCVQVCPKGVDPMGRIMALRDHAIQNGYHNSNGARHAETFAHSVKHSGTLDELRLPIGTFGIWNVKEMLKLIPLGLKAQMRGKRPPIFHKAIPGAENVRRIFEKVEGKR